MFFQRQKKCVLQIAEIFFEKKMNFFFRLIFTTTIILLGYDGFKLTSKIDD